MRSGQRVLLEGQLGVGRDIDWGIYPYTTASSPTAGGACVGAGIPPRAIDEVLGVVKAYSTSVGGGPFPTELHDEWGARLQEVGREFGATTGRPRRCGWFDGVAIGYASWLNGFTGIAVTKLDVLDHFEEIKLCTGYRRGDGRSDQVLDYVPDTATQALVEPSMRRGPAGRPTPVAAGHGAICPRPLGPTCGASRNWRARRSVSSQWALSARRWWWYKVGGILNIRVHGGGETGEISMSRHIIRDLGDGLIMRRSTVEDTEALMAFHGDVHRDPGVEEREEYVAAWVRDLMERPHPSFDVATLPSSRTRTGGHCLVDMPDLADLVVRGVQFGVGRPELVGTHADYRRRGLVRAQFDVIHRWSAERGEKMQAITGIPYFYRQFGYEMGLTLGGSRAGYKRQVPKLKEGQEEAYRLRPVVETDLPFIAQVYEHGNGAIRWPACGTRLCGATSCLGRAKRTSTAGL